MTRRKNKLGSYLGYLGALTTLLLAPVAVFGDEYADADTVDFKITHYVADSAAVPIAERLLTGNSRAGLPLDFSPVPLYPLIPTDRFDIQVESVEGGDFLENVRTENRVIVSDTIPPGASGEFDIIVSFVNKNDPNGFKTWHRYWGVVEGYRCRMEFDNGDFSGDFEVTDPYLIRNLVPLFPDVFNGELKPATVNLNYTQTPVELSQFLASHYEMETTYLDSLGYMLQKSFDQKSQSSEEFRNALIDTYLRYHPNTYINFVIEEWDSKTPGPFNHAKKELNADRISQELFDDIKPELSDRLRLSCDEGLEILNPIQDDDPVVIGARLNPYFDPTGHPSDWVTYEYEIRLAKNGSEAPDEIYLYVSGNSGNMIINTSKALKYYEDENCAEYAATIFLEDKDSDSDERVIFHFSRDPTIIGNDEPSRILRPLNYSLFQNYPNPFNPSTTIKYSLESDTPVRLDIYNMRGRLVRELDSGYKPAGIYEVHWNGRDDRGNNVPSGVYLYRLEADGKAITRKMNVWK